MYQQILALLLRMAPSHRFYLFHLRGPLHLQENQDSHACQQQENHHNDHHENGRVAIAACNPLIATSKAHHRAVCTLAGTLEVLAIVAHALVITETKERAALTTTTSIQESWIADAVRAHLGRVRSTGSRSKDYQGGVIEADG